MNTITATHPSIIPIPSTPPAPSAHSARDLPHRPRMLAGLPVLRRLPGEAQVGAALRHAVVISGVPETVGPLLHALDGRDTADELLARAGPGDHALAQILASLAGLGLLDDASPGGRAPTDTAALGGPARLSADHTAVALRAGHQVACVAGRREDVAVVVHGSGRVAVGLAALLAAAGVGWVQVVAAGVVQPEDTGCGYLDDDIGRSRAEAAATAIRRATPEARTGRLPPSRRPDLVVIADVMVADPRLSADLVSTATPHLLAYAAEGVGVVGPLVVPGRTACLRCADLRNTETDPCWPTLAAQLAARTRSADLATAQATSAFAAGQVLRFLHGPDLGVAELAVFGGSIELDTFTGRTRRVTVPAHPNCPCGAAQRRSPRATADGGREPIPSW